MRVFLLIIVILLSFLPSSAGVTPAAASLVGSLGNEPLVRVAADGTVYVSALQHLYRSTDDGATWTPISPPIFAGAANVASDSSIDVSPDGHSIAMAFDWPYAGQTAVCVSADHGGNWTCDPVAVPGATDRMWVHYLSDGRLILVTGEGLDATLTFVQPSPLAPAFLPGTFVPLAAIGQLGDFAQGWGATAHDNVLVLPSSRGPSEAVALTPQGGLAGSQTLRFGSTGIPSYARDAAGALYGTNETGLDASGNGHGLTLVRYHGSVGSLTWSEAPVVSGGNVTFSAIAAGPNGTVTIDFYWAPAGDQAWVPYRATTTDAQDATPTFDVAPLADHAVHHGAFCASLSCGGNARFAGDFIGATFDAQGRPWWTWMEEGANNATRVMAAHG